MISLTMTATMRSSNLDVDSFSLDYILVKPQQTTQPNLTDLVVYRTWML